MNRDKMEERNPNIFRRRQMMEKNSRMIFKKSMVVSKLGTIMYIAMYIQYIL